MADKTVYVRYVADVGSCIGGLTRPGAVSRASRAYRAGQPRPNARRNAPAHTVFDVTGREGGPAEPCPPQKRPAMGSQTRLNTPNEKGGGAAELVRRGLPTNHKKVEQMVATNGIVARRVIAGRLSVATPDGRKGPI